MNLGGGGLVYFYFIEAARNGWMSVGLISAPEAAEEIIANERADLVTLGRILLFDPYWPLHATKTLKSKTVSWPLQYERANIF